MRNGFKFIRLETRISDACSCRYQHVLEPAEARAAVAMGTVGEQHSVERAMQAALRDPWNLEIGPVIRLTLWREDDQDSLLLTAHHIALDGWSRKQPAERSGACCSSVFS